MASMTYRELRRLLVDHGCRYLRDARGGGHEIWLCPRRKPISVPKTLKGEGTLRKILRMPASTESALALPSSVAGWSHEHPLVAPQVSHLRQVPLRINVKLPHSSQLSPS
jgi:hypothetical protein